GPLLRFGGGAVVHGDLMATLLREVSCHGETHDAESEKCDFGHICYLVLPGAAQAFAAGGGIGGDCTIPPRQYRQPGSFGVGPGICARLGHPTNLTKKGVTA